MNKPIKPPPPLFVSFFTIFVLCITCWNAIRTYSAIVNWQVLSEYGSIPAYIFGTGALWTLIGIWLLRILWTRHHDAIRFCLTAVGLYYAWYWCDRLFIQASPAPNVLFSAIFSSFLVVILISILSLPSTKAFFIKERR